MANSNSNTQELQSSLKYLGFFPLAFGKASVYMSTIYEAAKDQAGPLKPGVEDVECTFKTVLGPVFRSIETNSIELLHFVDKKVDEKLKAIDDRVPSFIKASSNQAYKTVMQGPQMARTVVSEVKALGYYETAKSLYLKYEPVAEQWSYDAFEKLMRLPLVPRVVRVVAPPALYSAEKLNHFAIALKDRRVPLASYIPVMPIERFEKAVETPVKHGKSCNCNACEHPC